MLGMPGIPPAACAKRIRSKDLAEALGLTEVSVYKLRGTDNMPRLTEERLEGICKVLRCQPGDLLWWIPDEEADND